jgi:hypothetical protein
MVNQDILMFPKNTSIVIKSRLLGILTMTIVVSYDYVVIGKYSQVLT